MGHAYVLDGSVINNARARVCVCACAGVGVCVDKMRRGIVMPRSLSLVQTNRHPQLRPLGIRKNNACGMGIETRQSECRVTECMIKYRRLVLSCEYFFCSGGKSIFDSTIGLSCLTVHACCRIYATRASICIMSVLGRNFRSCAFLMLCVRRYR